MTLPIEKSCCAVYPTTHITCPYTFFPKTRGNELQSTYFCPQLVVKNENPGSHQKTWNPI